VRTEDTGARYEERGRLNTEPSLYLENGEGDAPVLSCQSPGRLHSHEVCDGSQPTPEPASYISPPAWPSINAAEYTRPWSRPTDEPASPAMTAGKAQAGRRTSKHFQPTPWIRYEQPFPTDLWVVSGTLGNEGGRCWD